MFRIKCQLEKCPFAETTAAETTATTRCIIWHPDGSFSICAYAIVEFSCPEKLDDKPSAEFPETCPICGALLFRRADLDAFRDDTYSELWECDNHHLFRAVYKLVKFERLKEGETDSS